MHIITVGLNHKSAPLNVREQLSFSSSKLCAFLDVLHRKQREAPTILHENIVVSTCNRLEHYALVPNAEQGFKEIIRRFSRIFQIPAEAFESHLYFLKDDSAVEHLMRVACGLDSMVLGEAQILGQLVQAHQSARQHDTAGTILSRLFETAIHAGKRARTETGIGLNPASISSVAIQLGLKHLQDMSDKTVMLVGAGKMITLAIKILIDQGLENILIVNRTHRHAKRLANIWNGTALTFDEIETGLQQTDLVIASTGAPHSVVHKEQVVRAMQTRPDRPMMLIDIAVPRDIDPDVQEIPNIRLHNLDDLQAQVVDNLQERENEIPYVEAIIAAEQGNFNQWHLSLGVVPTLTSFRRQVEDIRQNELERTLNRMQDLSDRDREIVTELSRRLMKKFLHQPTVQLRQEAAHGNGINCTAALQKLFALEINEL